MNEVCCSSNNGHLHVRIGREKASLAIMIGPGSLTDSSTQSVDGTLAVFKSRKEIRDM